MKKIRTMVSMLVVMCICIGILIHDRSNVYADNIEAYYIAVDELNAKYDAEITMPSRNEIVHTNIMNMTVEEFKNEIEREYLEVSNLDNYLIRSLEIESDNSASAYSSGVKTQYCYMKNGNGDKIGVLYLTANVVEAGVNQYTSIIQAGSLAQSTCYYYFNAQKSSARLSSDYKTCTATYSGSFINVDGVSLTTYKTYTVEYRVKGGDMVMLLGTVV